MDRRQDQNFGQDDFVSGPGVYEPDYPRPFDLDAGRIRMGSEPEGYYGSGVNYTRRQSSWDTRRTSKDHPKEESFIDSVKSFFGIGPKGYKRSDERIHEDVCETLARHPEIDASDIEVNVSEGMVTLEGQVDSRRVKRLAEDVLDHISGVKDVHNFLKVRGPEVSIPINPSPTTGVRKGKSPSRSSLRM